MVVRHAESSVWTKQKVFCFTAALCCLAVRIHSVQVRDDLEVIAAACVWPNTLIDKSHPPPHQFCPCRWRYDTVIPPDTVSALVPLPVSLLARWARKGTRWSHQCWHGWREGLGVSDITGATASQACPPPIPPPRTLHTHFRWSRHFLC